MIIWVYGDDTFRSRQQLKTLVRGFKEKFDPNGLNLISFKEKLTRDEVFQAAATAPFMAPKKMIIVENLTAAVRAKEWEDLKPLWKRVSEETILVLWEEGAPKELDKAFNSMPKKDIHFYDYPLLSALEIQKWLAALAKEKNIRISPALINQLIEKVGPDTWRLDSELEKLRSRALGAEIKKEYIDELVDTRLEDNVFVFCDQLSKREARGALSVVQSLINSGINEAELVSKLVWQLRVLLKLKSYFEESPGATINNASRDLGIHPYAARKVMPLLKKFTAAEIKEIYRQALVLDAKSKTGQIDPRLGLEMLVAKI